MFLQDPPHWRTLCKEIVPHSKKLIRNCEINPYTIGSLESPESFCHYNPDTENSERVDEKKLPKTLVCHDMANGYHDDSVIDGTSNYDAYTFYNWAGIDIFCYFSHHLITIPPVSWINVGHAHGVKVIGTVITEWAEGVVFWDKILDSELEYQNFISALVAIAKTLKFDGWLLNIENKIAKPDVLLEFVKALHKTLHQELVDPVLIWYDSVTIKGHLNWQNGLNEQNKAFFDACDGLFTNYSWTEENVMSSAEAAGDRIRDLYIGIDVWGRNFYGGGQFNTAQAIKTAHDYGCSFAIFAPAWSHEAMSTEKDDVNAVITSAHADKWSTFVLRDRAFWGSIWPYLNTRVPSELPFQTSFCRGQGKKRRLHGEVLCPVPWYNLRHQQYQPNSAHGPHGYLLSNYDNILQVTRLEASKDNEGIVAYRESFQMTSVDIRDAESKTGNLMAIEEVGVNKQDGGRPKTVKRKMQNAFKQMFQLKNRKRDNQAVDEYVSTAASTSFKSGKSMVQMSVNIKLGVDRIRYVLTRVPEEMECLEVYLDDSFTGGSCLRINPSDKCSPEHRFIRLFHCDFNCKDSLIACVVTKKVSGFRDQYLNVILNMQNAKGEDFTAVLVGRNIPQEFHVVEEASGVVNLYPVNFLTQEVFRNLQKCILLNHPDFYVPVESCYDWNVWYYELVLPGSRITSIACRTGLAEGPILLGHFGLCEMIRSHADN